MLTAHEIKLRTETHLDKEVWAKCAFCKDMFTVVIQDRRGEVTIEPSRTIGHDGSRVIHKPGLCNGVVELVGRDQELKFIATDSFRIR